PSDRSRRNRPRPRTCKPSTCRNPRTAVDGRSLSWCASSRHFRRLHRDNTARNIEVRARIARLLVQRDAHRVGLTALRLHDSSLAVANRSHAVGHGAPQNGVSTFLLPGGRGMKFPARTRDTKAPTSFESSEEQVVAKRELARIVRGGTLNLVGAVVSAATGFLQVVVVTRFF